MDMTFHVNTDLPGYYDDISAYLEEKKKKSKIGG